MWRPPKAFRFCQCIELCWAEALFAFGGCFLSPQLGRHCDLAPSSVMRRAAKEACNTLHRVCAKKLEKIIRRSVEKNESFDFTHPATLRINIFDLLYSRCSSRPGEDQEDLLAQAEQKHVSTHHTSSRFRIFHEFHGRVPPPARFLQVVLHCALATRV